MSISHKNIFFGVLFFLFSFFLGFFVNFFGTLYVSQESTENPPIYINQKVEEVYNIIEKQYYGFHSKDPKKMEDDFLSAMSIALGDKFTNYFNVKDSVKFTDSLAGDFQGIGAVIQEHKKGIQIMKVIENSPAKKNNLQDGDIITHVEGVSMVGVPVTEAVDKIRGPKGTTVKLTIISLKTEEKREISLVRDTVVVPSVESKMLSGSIGYIEISVFGETTAKDVKEGIEKLTLSGAKSFILDGRNNGGGYLDSAVDILSFILEPNSLAVTTKGNNPKDNQTYITTKQDISIGNVPLVMLINPMSASATEIVAGALQDHERALIVGDVSYGKGSVQMPFPLSDGSLLKVTIAKWFTPKNRGIDEKGITPDIEIHFKDEDYKENYDRQLEGAIKIITLQSKSNLKLPLWKEEALKLTY